MSKITTISSVPLIVSDPYFSIWSPGGRLNENDTQSWTGKVIPIRGYLKINEGFYRFMGADQKVPAIEQKELEVTPTQTRAIFENDLVRFIVTFSVNLDLNDLQKISEPVTIITTEIETKISNAEINVIWQISDQICQDSSLKENINFDVISTAKDSVAWMGKAKQTPLSATGDLVDIDWGYFYTAMTDQDPVCYQKNQEMLEIVYPLKDCRHMLVAYDDIYAINYFGKACNAFWKNKYNGMYELLQNRKQTIQDDLKNCQKIDRNISVQAEKIGGEIYEFLTSMSYRQSICAHKLITDQNGEVIFLSKECSSNGCIGTVDISYPSSPLYLLYQPELLKGMLRPIYHFTQLPVWEFDFAPHDVGRYPYVTGQVYGEQPKKGITRGTRDTIFDYFTLPKGQEIYSKEFQMPVEECGNMLILSSAILLIEKDPTFFNQYMDINTRWADYLLKFGQDPENQLCTDDFAGHLAHNANLALKAIIALRMFGKAMNQIKATSGDNYWKAAEEMTKEWLKMADGNTSTKLAFDQENSWSMKYNLVWDKIFDLNLFADDIIANELTKYQSESNQYGIPLDNRDTYTKADWIIWIATLTNDKKKFLEIISPVKHYLENTSSHVPFSDWYDTKTARMVNFKNRTVVGAIFMPLLKSILHENTLN